ncbi:MAG TPA: adenylosuccinate lyase, partial [Gammaproteobacteria bacterium]|nr:adenylosuccinate lyase [Gammaproteobacteria bacterium]
GIKTSKTFKTLLCAGALFSACASAQPGSGHEKYTSPLDARYASDEMLRLWSDDTKFKLWRRMWAVLAKSQMELGVKEITPAQVAELQAAIDMPIDYQFAAAQEKKLRHDVMAHVYTLAEQCPTAKPIIHLGATSMDIQDNAELIQLKQAMALLRLNVLQLLDELRVFALANKDVVTLGYTHGQAAQLTTVGKRACMWAESLQIALDHLDAEMNSLKLRGIKGTTGTQATLLAMFHGDHAKVDKLEALVLKELGFKEAYAATGQTYPRNVDYHVVSSVAGVGVAIAKMCEDIRLLASHGELSEPFESSQIGSSAMAYKQNPMRSERACSLARDLIGLAQQPAYTSSTQWLERSLDDSANRRIVLPEAFLLCDAVNKIALNVVKGLRVNKAVIARHVRDELPFMATEQIILDSVAQGGDRQNMHEAIRELSVKVAKNVKEDGLENNLIALIGADERFPVKVRDTLKIKPLDPTAYIGRSSQQVDVFCKKLDQKLVKSGLDRTVVNKADLKV